MFTSTALIALTILVISGASIAFLARRLSSADKRINGLKGVLRAAQLENKLMEMVLSNANDGLLVQDEHGIIEWSNPAYSRITGFSAEELHGRSPFEFVVPPETRPSPEYIANFTYDFESGVLDRFEIVRNIRKNGEYFWNQLSFAVVDYGDGSPRKVIVIARDVTEQIEREEALERAKADLQHLAETDALTGLSNRLKLSAFLEEAMRDAQTAAGEVGLLHIDLDQFKEANDVFGHAAGDAVLAHTANILRAACGDNDLACRVGGDEFIIVRRGARSMSELEALGRLILAQIKSPLDWENERILLGASIGIAMSGPDSRNAQTLMRNADIALYEIKNTGRNAVLAFSEHLGARVAMRTEISSALSHGLANDELCVLLQPQVDLAARRTVGFEALVRWRHPRRGLLAPADFFDVAERTGLMEGIDQIATRKALDALAALHAAGHSHLRMSINVSGQRLSQPDYLDQLKWEVDRRGLSPGHVTVEILETLLIEERDNQAALSISALANAGFGVELDDFGSGYSGLVNLARLDIQGVKIDRALVQNLASDLTSQKVVQAIFSLCQDLGLGVVSEGIEQPAQAEAIMAFGGRIVQGFGIARPMALEAALTWMDKLDPTAMPGTTLPVIEPSDLIRVG